MEALVREMQDPENGVPVRSQKVFLTSIPSAFMGYDLIEWLMERLGIEESEALNIANQLCQYGYFFPINDSKNLVVKDDSSLYRFQSPYYWPWQQRTPDNVEYAIYLAKRTLRNKQRHGLEEYEQEALTNLRKNLQNKWDYITLQAEEQVKLAKERKKGDKIVSDSQERAYWRVYRPPPGFVSSLEQCPVPNRNRNGFRQRRRTLEDCRREVELLKNSLTRTRVKVSQALESMIQYVETYAEYDPLITGTQPSNPWVTEDMTYWHINNPYVDIPTEKRVRRWALSMEELVSDATGLHEFTTYLRKEYSHENIRFWMAVNDLRRSSQSQIQRKVQEIFEEFLAPGAPCEINIDGKTMEKVHQELRQPSRFTFDSAAEHVYTLLLKKDCYPRFIRSEQYKMLLASAKQPSQKKRFFNFGPAKKKVSTSSGPAPSQLQQAAAASATATPAVGCGGALSRRRGSDRSLSGSAHELAVCGVRDTTRVPHSHSQSNLSDIPYREPEPAAASGVCPWDEDTTPTDADKVKKPSIAVVPGSSTSEDVYPWEPPVAAAATTDRNLEVRSRKNSGQLDSGSSSSDISLAIVDVSDRVRRSSGLGHQTESAEKRGSTQQQPQPVTASQRKLSTASCGEPVARRASVSAIGVKQVSDATRPSVSSFEECTSSLQPPCELALPSDIDNTEEPAARKKSPGLRKACSVGPASAPAPTISVSSALDDTSTPSIPSATRAPSIGQRPSSSSPPPPISSPLAPLAVPDSESPASEWAPDLEEEFAARAQDPASSDVPPPTLTPPSSPPPDAPTNTTNTTTTTAAAAIATAATSAGEPNHPATADGKQTDICPWEDEESCKIDAPFVKTYATLGYL